jgi:endonuclease/exonuclease/phosphatase (EEP) superfamily protein YafD
MRNAFRWLWVIAAWISLPILLAGLVVRFPFLRDEYTATGVLFYATPWPVLWAMSLLCTGQWWPRPRLRWVFLCLTICCFTMVVWTGFGFAPHNSDKAALRIAYWNVARPVVRLNSVLEKAAAWKADFYVFGEHRVDPPTPPAYRDAFPRHKILPLSRELLLVSPGEVKPIDGGSLGGSGGCKLCRVVVQGREVFLLLVDFTASITKSRRPAFDRLLEIVKAYEHKPLIVIGDFNTPADSAHFDRLRVQLSGAFETAGRGYAATWPMPLPVLQLDHIWTNKHLRVIRCEHETSIASDHRPVIADIVFAK